MEPFYIEGCSGKLFAIHYRPQRESRGAILFAPPFAEEMNRSRLMVSRQARRFAEAGFDVLLVDYYGTGDSEGEFQDASLQIWTRDLSICMDWLINNGAVNLYIWGLRFGCLLATLVTQDLRDKIAGWIFWEPVTEGAEIVNDLLRIERVARMLSPERSGHSVSDVVETGTGIKQIAGYQISTQLMDELKQSKIENLKSDNVDCYQVHAQTSSEQQFGNSEGRSGEHKNSGFKTIDVVDCRFWLTPEVSVAGRLMEITTANLLAGLSMTASKPVYSKD